MVLLEVSLGWSKNELRSNIGRVCKELSRLGISRPFDLEVVQGVGQIGKLRCAWGKILTARNTPGAQSW
jgi:hypothetical protein